MENTDWTYEGDGQAYPSDRLVPDFLRDGEEWHERGKKDGESVIVCYYFPREIITVDGEPMDAEDYPWEEDNIAWIATTDGMVIKSKEWAGFTH